MLVESEILHSSWILQGSSSHEVRKKEVYVVERSHKVGCMIGQWPSDTEIVNAECHFRMDNLGHAKFSITCMC